MMKDQLLMAGEDIQPGQVVKIGGRWYRMVRWIDAEWQGQSGYKVAQVIEASKDPRLGRFPAYYKVKLIWRDELHKAREQAAPEWDWVTKKLEREAADA